MLFSHISTVEKYDCHNERFKRAYRWLEETDLSKIAVGAYPVGGDDVIANVQEYTTVPANEVSFETHDKYFDIQYIISGKEQFGVCKRDGLIVREEKPENDLVFYEEPGAYGSMLLLPGDLVVVTPQDAHKPCCAVALPELVRKVVIKIKV